MNDNFNESILPDVSPFEVDWANVKEEKRTTKQGGERIYNIYLVPILGNGLQRPITVELFRTSFDRLRILSYMGFKKVSVTPGLPQKEGGRVPYTYSGASK